RQKTITKSAAHTHIQGPSQVMGLYQSPFPTLTPNRCECCCYASIMLAHCRRRQMFELPADPTTSPTGLLWPSRNLLDLHPTAISASIYKPAPSVGRAR